MEVVKQTIVDILAGLRPLQAEWRDDTARRVIEKIAGLPRKEVYAAGDVLALLDADFKDGILICRTFLGLSDDQFQGFFRDVRGSKGCGIKAFKADKAGFVDDLVGAGVLEAMAAEVNREPHWSDTLVERLRSGRGSAISDQQRGRGAEDFVQAVLERVFGGGGFVARCSFVGANGAAKCDFAVPSKSEPRIVIEAKAFGATGSKMSDVVNDAIKIKNAKRHDTAFLLFTDGTTWRQRRKDMSTLVEMQNRGEITRIYTSSMVAQLEADLRELKGQYKL